MANYWLMKSEPDVYSIQTLRKEKTTLWDGVRNYQARNFMRDKMQVGDLVLFYHSNSKPPGVAGLGLVTGEAQPDPTQFDKKSKYYDPKSDPENPRWKCVEVGFKEVFPNYVSLPEIKNTKGLSEMLLVQKGQRLSIQPVTKKHFDKICKMGRK